MVLGRRGGGGREDGREWTRRIGRERGGTGVVMGLSCV